MKTTFSATLRDIKTEIDAALHVHVSRLEKQAATEYTPYSAVAVEAFTSVLGRGGKRLRGALSVIGYEMSGGTDRDMIIQAACVIELTHAYILVLDDIMDKSIMRRGGPSAHTALARYHETHGLSGESAHFGEAIAINAAFIGYHYAQDLITNLSVPDQYKVRALQLLNSSLVTTGHGQINDLFNEVRDSVNEADIQNVLEWKTAHYTFLNPLQFGMALAGADDEALTRLHDYSIAAGKAFQITDDILGTFSSEHAAGKNPMDDLREGKRTAMVVYALEHADSGDKNFLIQMLGNESLTQTEFARCKEILVATGALTYAEQQAQAAVAAAHAALEALPRNMFAASGISFLGDLAAALLGRHS